MKIFSLRSEIFIKQVLCLNLLLFLFGGCSQKNTDAAAAKTSRSMYSVTDEKQKERDEIFSLLAYSIVYSDWQEDSIPRNKRRGYNIGSVLVNPKNEPVYFALNSVGKTNNATQHGEVRLMTQYLDSVKSFDLKNYLVYTTLEPCAMCGGMMTMTLVSRTIFGQNDVEYSHSLERLSFDSRSIGGYAPFPRKVISDPSPSIITAELNNAYQEFLKTDPEKILAKFLVSKTAKNLFYKASQQFLQYNVKFEENKKIYSLSAAFYQRILISKNH